MDLQSHDQRLKLLRCTALLSPVLWQMMQSEAIIDQSRQELLKTCGGSAQKLETRLRTAFDSMSSGDVVVLEQMRRYLHGQGLFPSHDDMYHLFRRHDRGGNGKLTVDEWVMSLMPLSSRRNNRSSRSSFSTRTTHTTGTTSSSPESALMSLLRTEMEQDGRVNFLCAQLARIPDLDLMAVFNHVDADHDGYITLDELRACVASNEAVESIMRKNDGRDSVRGVSGRKGQVRAIPETLSQASDRHWDLLMFRFDRDADGKMSYFEWVDAFALYGTDSQETKDRIWEGPTKTKQGPQSGSTSFAQLSRSSQSMQISSTRTVGRALVRDGGVRSSSFEHLVPSDSLVPDSNGTSSPDSVRTHRSMSPEPTQPRVIASSQHSVTLGTGAPSTTSDQQQLTVTRRVIDGQQSLVVSLSRPPSRPLSTTTTTTTTTAAATTATASTLAGARPSRTPAPDAGEAWKGGVGSTPSFLHSPRRRNPNPLSPPSTTSQPALLSVDDLKSPGGAGVRSSQTPESPSSPRLQANLPLSHTPFVEHSSTSLYRSGGSLQVNAGRSGPVRSSPSTTAYDRSTVVSHDTSSLNLGGGLSVNVTTDSSAQTLSSLEGDSVLHSLPPFLQHHVHRILGYAGVGSVASLLVSDGSNGVHLRCALSRYLQSQAVLGAANLQTQQSFATACRREAKSSSAALLEVVSRVFRTFVVEGSVTFESLCRWLAQQFDQFTVSAQCPWGQPALDPLGSPIMVDSQTQHMRHVSFPQSGLRVTENELFRPFLVQRLLRMHTRRASPTDTVDFDAFVLALLGSSLTQQLRSDQQRARLRCNLRGPQASRELAGAARNALWSAVDLSLIGECVRLSFWRARIIPRTNTTLTQTHPSTPYHRVSAWNAFRLMDDQRAGSISGDQLLDFARQPHEGRRLNACCTPVDVSAKHLGGLMAWVGAQNTLSYGQFMRSLLPTIV